MRQIWMIALASFALIGLAATVSATAVATTAAAGSDARPQGRVMMVEAQYRLAMAIGR